MKSLNFRFAPKSSTKVGPYFLGFSTTATGFAPMKSLLVVALSEKCKISNTNSFTFTAAKNAQSLPYVIDFSLCEPEYDVSLTIHCHNTDSKGLVDKTNSSLDSTNFIVGGDISKVFEI